MRSEPVQCTVFHVEGDNTDTLAILHNQVKSEKLDEEVGVVTERLSVESVEKGMTCAVGGGGTAICLSTLSILERLATKRTLIDFPLLRSGERNTIVFKLIK